LAFVNGTGHFTATLRKDHFPYLAQSRKISLAGFELYGLAGTSAPKHHILGDQNV
jgi:hypothetical protein